MAKHRKHKAAAVADNYIWKMIALIVLTLVVVAAVFAIVLLRTSENRLKEQKGSVRPTTQKEVYTISESSEPNDVSDNDIAQKSKPVFINGYLAAEKDTVAVFDASGAEVDRIPRGIEIKYSENDRNTDGLVGFKYGEKTVYVDERNIVKSEDKIVREKTIYVRTTVSMTDEDGIEIGALLEKGSLIAVLGYDNLCNDGSVDRYYVAHNGKDGYVASKYLTFDKEYAESNYDGNGMYRLHAERGDEYGGGDAGTLDFFPREKKILDGNIMPDEVKTLYLSSSSWIIENIDLYIEFANTCGINAFVIDIMDGGMVGYSSPVMEKYSPTTAEYGNNTMEEYGTAIQKMKEAGYYVIGRITTFNDPYFVIDHPECSICDLDGQPMMINTMFWPTAYNRYVWEYKTSLAVEAVEEFGFNEIQFDYVRFPDLTYKYEEAGTIDYNNTYGETKAQAIQRFLMYAADRVHAAGAYVGIDVFGECAFGYVTAYGQYWPALSGVVDVICGMPYPDHFSQTGSYKPWLYPYDTLFNWAKSVNARQDETENPAAVRTWIQAYDAIKSPYNTYGPDEVGDEIRGLHDAGIYGGYMTWNFASSLEKYRSLAPAFNI